MKVYQAYILFSKLINEFFSFFKGFSHMSYQGDNNHYMLHHFLLIFPTWFKGVLVTYLHYSPHIFPQDIWRSYTISYTLVIKTNIFKIIQGIQDIPRRSFVQGVVLGIV